MREGEGEGARVRQWGSEINPCPRTLAFSSLAFSITSKFQTRLSLFMCYIKNKKWRLEIASGSNWTPSHLSSTVISPFNLVNIFAKCVRFAYSHQSLGGFSQRIFEINIIFSTECFRSLSRENGHNSYQQLLTNGSKLSKAWLAKMLS